MKEKCRRIAALPLIAVLLLIVACVIAVFSGCSSGLLTEPSAPQPNIPQQTETNSPKAEQFVMPEVEVAENRAEELVFKVSMNDYIKAYNSLYREDNGEDYLTQPEQWTCTVRDEAIHSPHETFYYYFTEDECAFSLPTISVYVPSNGDYIQEITVNFDDHSYSSEMYVLYEEMCFYTLKAIFPQLDDERIIELYKEANALGYANVFPNEQGYNSSSVPCVLYHKDGIGIYPYFAIGQWQHLCIVPVTEETIADFAAKGTEIREIK